MWLVVTVDSQNEAGLGAVLEASMLTEPQGLRCHQLQTPPQSFLLVLAGAEVSADAS